MIKLIAAFALVFSGAIGLTVLVMVEDYQQRRARNRIRDLRGF